MCTDDTGRGFSRRRFIAHSAAAIAALVSPAAFARYTQSGYRRLGFRHLHTGESLTVTYWENGRYLPDALGEINYLLRDHRSDDVHPIAPGLLDTLTALQTSMEFNAPYEVISGFRSRATNEKLRRMGRAVARRSMHLEGKAVDVRVAGQNLQQMRATAMALQAGGVGYYSRSGFIHLDVGRVRSW